MLNSRTSFNGHFPAEPGLASCPLDNQCADSQGQAATVYIVFLKQAGVVAIRVRRYSSYPSGTLGCTPCTYINRQPGGF